METREQPRVILFSPPWMKAGWPSLGIATLKADLASHGILAQTSHFHLETAARLGWKHYEAISETWGAGEALFGALIDSEDSARLRAYAGNRLRQAGHEELAVWAEGPACEEIAQLIDLWIDESGALEAAVVGASVGALQLCGAIYLMQQLRMRGHRGTRVLGGSGLVGDVAPVVLKRVPAVDFLVNGEGEVAFRHLVKALLEGDEEIAEISGVLAQGMTHTPGNPVIRAPAVDLSKLPPPELDDFFGTAARFGIPSTALTLSFEHSRGCEWEHRSPGKLKGCTFCGLYRTSPDFRRKPVEQVARQVQDSVNRYRNLNVAFVDAYLPEGDRDLLLDQLNALPEDITYFSELRCDMTASSVSRLVKRARHVQLGVESFSTAILKRIGKGVSGAHSAYNVRICQEMGLSLQYNILYGVPGVPVHEIEAFVESLPALYGLVPPQPAKLYLDRNSLMYSAPEEHGICRERLDEERHEWLPAALGDNAVSQVVSFETSSEAEDAWEILESAIVDWKRRWRQARDAGATSPLSWRSGSGWATITDIRGDSPHIFHLDGILLKVFLACDEVTTINKISYHQPELSQADLGSALDELVERGLIYRDSPRYVRVAVRATSP